MTAKNGLLRLKHAHLVQLNDGGLCSLCDSAQVLSLQVADLQCKGAPQGRLHIQVWVAAQPQDGIDETPGERWRGLFDQLAGEFYQALAWLL